MEKGNTGKEKRGRRRDFVITSKASELCFSLRQTMNHKMFSVLLDHFTSMKGRMRGKGREGKGREGKGDERGRQTRAE